MKKYVTVKNAGWLATIIAAVLLLMGAVPKVLAKEEMVQAFTYMKLLPYMGLVGFMEILAVGLLMFRKTALYGAALVGSIMSAAVAMHMSQFGNYGIMPMLIGLFAWTGYILREKF